jgi:uncharacterized protein DUF6438/ankyrin repeat protein
VTFVLHRLVGGRSVSGVRANQELSRNAQLFETLTPLSSWIKPSNLSRAVGVKRAMHHLKLLFGLAIFMSPAGVAYTQELPIITLRRTWCLGTCPIYLLQIFRDGRLHYNGEEFVAVIGSQEAQISPAAVERLVESFVKSGYFALNDVYETHQNPDGTTTVFSDLPTTYTSLRVGSRARSVKDYAFAPEKLHMLELEIDRVANTHRWIHGNDDLKDWEMVAPDVYRRTKPGMTLSMQAAGLGQADVLEKLHDAGADIDAQDETGWTALMLAAAESRLNTLQQLLGWHARIDLKDKNGDDALMGSASAFCYQSSCRDAQAQIIKLLLENGADPNLRDGSGMTPLMVLTRYGNTKAADTLLAAGAQIDAKDKDGRTALDHAKAALEKYSKHGWADELRMLVKMLNERSNS